jgi:hypothetical protein
VYRGIISRRRKERKAGDGQVQSRVVGHSCTADALDQRRAELFERPENGLKRRKEKRESKF